MNSQYQRFNHLISPSFCGLRGRLDTGVTIILAIGVAALLLARPASADSLTPRERTSFDEGWRFIKGDPACAGDQLSYAKIKGWFLPTGHDLTTNAALLAMTLPATNPIPDVT